MHRKDIYHTFTPLDWFMYGKNIHHNSAYIPLTTDTWRSTGTRARHTVVALLVTTFTTFAISNPPPILPPRTPLSNSPSCGIFSYCLSSWMLISTSLDLHSKVWALRWHRLEWRWRSAVGRDTSLYISAIRSYWPLQLYSLTPAFFLLSNNYSILLLLNRLLFTPHIHLWLQVEIPVQNRFIKSLRLRPNSPSATCHSQGSYANQLTGKTSRTSGTLATHSSCQC